MEKNRTSTSRYRPYYELVNRVLYGVKESTKWIQWIRHKGISEGQKARNITEFFSEDIGEIVKAGNVLNGNSFADNIFSDEIFPKVNPFHFLSGSAFSPLNGTLVVIVKGDGRGDRKVKITEKKLQLKD